MRCGTIKGLAEDHASLFEAGELFSDDGVVLVGCRGGFLNGDRLNERAVSSVTAGDFGDQILAGDFGGFSHILWWFPYKIIINGK